MTTITHGARIRDLVHRAAAALDRTLHAHRLALPLRADEKVDIGTAPLAEEEVAAGVERVGDAATATAATAVTATGAVAGAAAGGVEGRSGPPCRGPDYLVLLPMFC
jgi:hypothetical protein